MSFGIILFIVLALYLLVLFLIGLLSRKATATKEDFYLGGRKIGPWVSSFSFVAAYYSSVVIIGGGGFGYKYGMATLWVAGINVLVGTTLAWIVLGKRTRELTQKYNAVTMPEFLAKRYQSPVIQIISALIIAIFLIVYNVSILKAMANISQVLMNVEYLHGLLISGLIIVIYVSLGGYLAVVWTGFLQAWLMIIGLLLLTFFTLNKVGSVSDIFIRLGEINQNLIDTPGVWGWSGLVSYCMIVSFGVWGMPQLVSRFYSIRDVKVLRIGTVLATLSASIALLPYFNGAVSRILFPNLTNPDLAIPNLVKLVLSPFSQAIFLTGVMAAGMSTFSAVLLTAVSSLIKDFYEDGLQKKLDAKTHIRYARLVSVFIGILSLIVAIKPPAMILVLTAFSWSVIAGANLWPFFFSLYLNKLSKNAGLISMLGGAITALIWIIIKNPFGIHGFIPGIIASFLLYIIIHFFTKNSIKI
ncbi:MAG: hypothetical protein ABIK61_03335 [candidate division WOR-3 bacterium]